MKLVECVPNFSEGRDPEKIGRIASAIRSVPGILFLDVDSCRDANRTVMTFAGEPGAVLEAAFRSVRTAAEVIDMRSHRGAHPRIGAADVCPLVPLTDMTLSECSDLSRILGKRIADELNIPVYLYEAAAVRPERRRLADIRRGGYERLREKLEDPAWFPDFGEPVFNPQAGAASVGARNLLVAYNVNLDTKDARIAREIAGEIRASGGIRRDRNSIRTRTPGLFKSCRAIGWMLEEEGRVQVSTNLTDFRETPPHVVFGACTEMAAARGVRVTGSEVVGLVPLEALRMAGRHDLGLRSNDKGVADRILIRTAVETLGLNDLKPFDPERKILEYRLGMRDAL
ncbi:MAG TPA: glutamate formimidoyltransferase [bacterium]|nr:glutamate formimidoyltransferase [bacterium]